MVKFISLKKKKKNYPMCQGLTKVWLNDNIYTCNYKNQVSRGSPTKKFAFLSNWINQGIIITADILLLRYRERDNHIFSKRGVSFIYWENKLEFTMISHTSEKYMKSTSYIKAWVSGISSSSITLFSLKDRENWGISA